MSPLVPTPEQKAVMDLGLDTIRIRAGAGTGKTTTVAMVIANLVENHEIEPERILGITFTNKAAAELADRVRGILSGVVDEGHQAEVHTYHGFAAQVLAEFGVLAGVDSRMRLITPTFARQLLGETFHHTFYHHLDITNPRVLDRVRALGDRLSDHLLGPGDLAGHHPPDDEVWATRAEMLEALSRYGDEKKRLGVVDYGDLVTMSTSLMREFPELAAEVRSRYRAVILDEYQDTNPAQRFLLSTIFNDGFPVIAVGDEDQTIYEWRGATAENFELFPVHFRGRDGDPAYERGLTLNRRSGQVILDVANLIRRRGNPAAETLKAHEPERSGFVETYWATDAIAEAEWIAGKLQESHDDGLSWSDMAVLFRKNGNFAVVVEAMRQADIPIEMANLGGLLSVPEVGELRAWLTILDRPENSAALTQILFGSRYRLGFADIAPLTRWLAKFATGDDRGTEPAIGLLEAIEHLDAASDIRPEARDAFEHFLMCYRKILTQSQGESLVETCRLILDRTRAWQDIEALPANQRITGRLNLYRLLDLAEDWSPLRGRPSLGAFLDHLALMEDDPAEDLDSAHLSGEDAVTLITVHRAKGLEWEVVSIPAVFAQNFPSRWVQQPDPLKFAEHIPAEHRIDAALVDLPSEPNARKEFFSSQNAQQEWRVAYVAVTRAKSRLLVSGAYWYGLPEPTVNPKQPSELFEIIASHPQAESAGHAPETPRPTLLRHETPGSAPDPHFTNGWTGALRDALDDHQAMPALASELGLADELSQEVDRLSETLFALDEAGLPEAEVPERVISVTGLVTYAGCPKRYYWSDVDPLPRRRNPAADAGTVLHRRIELYQRGQVPFEELAPDLYDAPDESTGPGGYAVFQESRFAKEHADLVEAPFVLRLDNGHNVRGRIDAIYTNEGIWEIVDFKSGAPSREESRVVQLQAYALAANQADLGLPPPSSTTVTFAYMGGGLNVETYQANEAWLAEAEHNLISLTDSIEAENFQERPGDRCGSCDFLRFCDPGQKWLADK